MGKATPSHLWDPPTWGRHAAIWFLPFVLILLACALSPKFHASLFGVAV